MFSNPASDPTASARADQRSQDESLAVVAELTGEQNARRYAALLLAGADGIAGIGLTGQLKTGNGAPPPKNSSIPCSR